jgi:hypothetical protein
LLEAMDILDLIQKISSLFGVIYPNNG